MPDYRMDLADYKGKTAEELRDLDRASGRLYFSEPMGVNMSGGNSSVSNTSSENSGGNTRSYTEGFEDGQTRGYSEGYERGRND